MTITLYGIPNCDTVKRARAWLEANQREATFHDFKKAGVPPDHLDSWAAAVGWERLLNRKGTAWRKLDDDVRDAVVDERSAKQLMRDQVSVIKRPVVEWADGAITVGFDESDWSRR
jgi:Spx/MgsR family transcriptional regulator